MQSIAGFPLSDVLSFTPSEYIEPSFYGWPANTPVNACFEMLGIEHQTIKFSLCQLTMLCYNITSEADNEKYHYRQLEAHLHRHRLDELTLAQEGSDCRLEYSKIDVSSLIDLDSHEKCQHAHKLTSIRVDLFDHFPGIEKLNALWITDKVQERTQLSKNIQFIHLKEKL